MMRKIRILFLAASPLDIAFRPRLDEEARKIQESLEDGEFSRRFEFITRWAVRPKDIAPALIKYKPHIVHFCGNGSKTQGILLQDDKGNTEPIGKGALVNLFNNHKYNTRLVFLNTSYSRAIATSLVQHIDFCIGMGANLRDEEAIVFAAGFYTALAYGHSINNAYLLAVNNVELFGANTHGNPKLLVRAGVDASQPLLELESKSPDSEAIRKPKTRHTGQSTKKQSKRLLQVFLCHSSGDKPQVRELYKRLLAEGFGPWLDEENLIPGQDWREEISKTVRNSDVVLVCLSAGAINKSGFIHKEIKYALDRADEQPVDSIYLIPVRLEECAVPDRLSRWQWVNLFDNNGYERLTRALKTCAAKLN